MTKFRAIREIASEYGTTLSTKSIIQKVNDKYGMSVSPQNVNAAIGSQRKRRLLAVNGQHYHETRKFIKKVFNDDIDLFQDVISIIRRNSI
tara:strand:+ start:1354 stop:1626 length:273 start_codon:yes stop_codon:yes gene_type:complete